MLPGCTRTSHFTLRLSVRTCWLALTPSDPPGSMRALVCEQLGNPLDPKASGLRLVPDQEPPKLSPHAVRIKVAAASLNFADALQVQVQDVHLSCCLLTAFRPDAEVIKRDVTQGLYQEKPKLPFIPGSEVSGVVLEAGSKVKSLAPGTKVRKAQSSLCSYPNSHRQFQSGSNLRH